MRGTIRRKISFFIILMGLILAAKSWANPVQDFAKYSNKRKFKINEAHLSLQKATKFCIQKTCKPQEIADIVAGAALLIGQDESDFVEGEIFELMKKYNNKKLIEIPNSDIEKQKNYEELKMRFEIYARMMQEGNG